MDDVSAVPTTGCNALNSSTVLYNYSSGIRRTYINIGGKWFLSSQTSYNTIPASTECIDIANLSTNSDMVPVFYFIAFCLALVVWWLWWSVFRRLFRWRIR